MDLHLPAVTRYLAETVEGTEPIRSAGQQEPGSKHDSPRAAGVSEITAVLSEQLAESSAPPPPIPKAVAAYYVGPAARAHPVDSDAKYLAPHSKHPHHPARPADSDPDPNGTHTARAVTPGRQPLALGPPRHSTVQKGHIAAAVTAAAAASAAAAAVPLDWSYLLGHPAKSGPLTVAAAAAAAGAVAAAVGAKVKTGSTTAGTSSADVTASGAAGGQSSSVRMSGVGGQSLRQTSQSGSGAGSMGALSRRGNAAAAALPATAEGKFCASVMGVMERLAATQSAQTGRYRSLRLQAAEQREAMLSTVQMPPPPKAGAFSSRESAARMEAVLQRSGASRDNMQAIVRQIQQFKGLSDDLRSAVAEQFHLFSYPPGSHLYEQDCRCDEAFVLVSGAAMLHVEGRPPQRLYPGTVLGVELLLRRQPVPLTVTTDPHFEAQMAVLSWHAYEDTVRRWAAEKVTALLPELQASQVARLQAALVRGVSYSQRQPGEPIYVGGQPAEHVALLVQGQVLVSAPLEDTDIVTAGQMVSQLKTLMGPLAGAMVLNELPRVPAAPRGGLRGGLKGGMRASDAGIRRSMPGGASTMAPSPLSLMQSGGGGGGDLGAAAAAAAAGGVHMVRMRGLLEKSASESVRHGGGDAAAASDGKVLRLRGPVEDQAESSPVASAQAQADSAAPALGLRARILARRDSVAAAAAAASMSGEAPAAAPAADSTGESAAAGGTDASQADGGGAADIGGGSRPSSGQQQQQRRARGRSGSQSGRNSRRNSGYDAAAAAVEMTEEHLAEGTAAMAEADGDVAAATEGLGNVADEETTGVPPAESAAAAASRATRVSLQFADNDAGGRQGGQQSPFALAEDPAAEAGGATGEGTDAAAQGEQANSSASGEAGPTGQSASGRGVGGSATQPESSLLPAISITDLASDPSSAYSAYSARAGTGSGSEGLGEPQTPVLGFKNASLAGSPTRVFGEPWAHSPRSDNFAFALGAGDSEGACQLESPATPVLFNLATGDGSETPTGSPSTAAETSTGGVSTGISIDGGEFTRVDDPAAGQPPLAAAAPLPPVVRGLRSKIGGDYSPSSTPPAGSPHGSRHHHSSSGSRTSSRGASPLVSGTSTPRSSSSTRLAAGGPGGGGSTSGGESQGLPPKPNSHRAGASTTSSAAASESGAARRGVSSSSGSARVSHGSGALRRPSSPTSEAPSVDDHAADGREAPLLVHPVLPPSPTLVTRSGDAAATAAESELPLRPSSPDASSPTADVDGGGDDDTGVAAAAAGEGEGGGLAHRPPAQHLPERAGTADGAPAESVASEASVEVAPPDNRARSASPAAASDGAANLADADSSAPSTAPTSAPTALDGRGFPVARQQSRLRLQTGDSHVPSTYAASSVSTDAPGGGVATSASSFSDKEPGMRLRMGAEGGVAAGGGGVDGRRSNVGRAAPSYGAAAASGGGSVITRRSEIGHGGAGYRVSTFGGGGAGGAAAGGPGAAQPLANALAMQLKQHRHKVAAVYGGPVVFCEEALSPPPASEKKAVRSAAHSAIALQRCEVILIPAALLRSLVPPALLPKLTAATVAAQRRLVQASGHVVETAPVTWPAAADRIRKILTTPPGQRQPWQVEFLAAAFSHLPAFARLTWQVRLKVFQDLEYRKLDPGSQLNLAKLDVTEVAPPRSQHPAGHAHRNGGGMGPETSSGSAAISAEASGAAAAAEGSGVNDPRVGPEPWSTDAASGASAAASAANADALAAYAEALAAEVGAVGAGTQEGGRAASRVASLQGEASSKGDVASLAPVASATASGDMVPEASAAGLPQSSSTASIPTEQTAAAASQTTAAGDGVGDASEARAGPQAPTVPPLSLSSTRTPEATDTGAQLEGAAGAVGAASLRSSDGTVESEGTVPPAVPQISAAAAAAAAAASGTRNWSMSGDGEEFPPAPTPRKQSWAERFGSRASQQKLAAEAAAAAVTAAAAAEPADAKAGAAPAVAAAGREAQGQETDGGDGRSSKRGSGSEPHTVEALFDPVAAEPLIPSLALNRRTPAPDTDGAAPAAAAAPPKRTSSWTPYVVGDATDAAAAAAVAAAAGLASTSTTPDLPNNSQYWAGDEPPDSAATLSSQVRAGTADTFLSEAPSHSMRSVGSAMSGRYGSISGRAEGELPPPTTPPEAVTQDGQLETEAQETATTEAQPPSEESGAAAAAAAEASMPHVPESSQSSQTLVSGQGSMVSEPLLPPRKREAVAVRLDDRAYWCLSGTIALEVQLQASQVPGIPNVNSSQNQINTAALSPEASELSSLGARASASLPQPPPTQQLQLAQPGDTFSGGALADAATAALAAPPGRTASPYSTLTSLDPGRDPLPTASFTSAASAAGGTGTATSDGAAAASRFSGFSSSVGGSPPLEAHQQLLQGLPLGSSMISARVVGETAAEVLCMSKPMFELVASGVGRSVPSAVLPVLARHVDWLIGVDLQAMANDLAGRYRLEDHKQGTELLRAGEAAPVVFLVAAGECLMRGPVVGLRDPASVAEGLDLATLREGATCGELSLLAARPLWYTLVVSSASAKVISIDLAALRTWLLTSALGQAAAAEVVAAVAEVDIALYGRAVKQIAAQVMCGKLELGLFTAHMKAIIRRILEDNASELAATLQHQRDQAEEKEKEKKREKERERGDRLGGADGGGSSGGGGGASSSNPAAATAYGTRPRSIVLEGWSQVEAIAASVARPYDPEAQSWELIAQAEYVASRRQQQRYLDSLFCQSQLATEEDAAGHATGGQRIAMPAPGLVAAALAQPTAVRQPLMFDIRTVPKDLRGSQVEAARLGWDTSFLPSHELSAMMDAQVHVKLAATGLLQPGQGPGSGQQGQLQGQGPQGLQGSQLLVQGQASQSPSSHHSLQQQQQQHQPRMLSGEVPLASSSLSTNATGSGSSGSRSVLGASNCLLARRAGSGGGGSTSTAAPAAAATFASINSSGAAAAAVHGTAAMAAAVRSGTLDSRTHGTTDSANSSFTTGIGGGGGGGGGAGGGGGGGRSRSAKSRLRIATPASEISSVVSLSPDHATEAPWDAQGRLRLLWETPEGGEDEDVPMSPSRLRRELNAASGWSLAQLEDLRKKSAIQLSRPASVLSAVLDPCQQAQMDVSALEELRRLYGGSAGSVGFGVLEDGASAAGSSHDPLRPGASPDVAKSNSAGNSPSRLRAMSFPAQDIPINVFPGSNLGTPNNTNSSNPSSLRRARNRNGGGGALGGPASPPLLSVIEEEEHPSLIYSSRRSPELGRAAAAAVAAVAAAGDGAAAAAGALPPALPLKPLPPLPPPHDQARLAKHASVKEAPAMSGSTAVTASTAPTAASAAASTAPYADGLTSAATATATATAASVGQSCAAAAAARRGRIQARTAAPPPPEPVDSPDRAFWVRNRLHDPQGLAQSVISDAAARAVSAAAAASASAAAAASNCDRVLPPGPPEAPSAAPPATVAAASAKAGSASANSLMAAGGRTGIPTIGRTRKLQPLKRNGGGGAAAAGDGGDAAAPATAGSLLAGTAAVATPAAALADADMLYVTLQLPPAPKLLPEFPSPAAAQEAAEAEAAAERAAREARLAASIAHPSARPLFVRPDLKYVPQYLRQRQRAQVLPPPVRHLPDAESDSWVVPSYSSEYGFKDGFYDENSQVIYFD